MTWLPSCAHEEFDDPKRQWCKECTNAGQFHRIRYPCSTVRAITAALNRDDTA